MYNKNTTRQGFLTIMGFAIAAVLFVFQSYEAKAQAPVIPTLSLVGEDGTYNDQWYPDGRIWMAPRNNQEPREFLMPVFIDNRWYTNEDEELYEAEPITSFKFRIQYDSAAVRPVGIQTVHPEYIPESAEDEAPLADGFDIDWYDYQDYSYREYIQEFSQVQSRRGRTITIVGSNHSPLPVNDNLNFPNYKVLLYVKFRVVPQIGNLATDAELSPVYVSPDTIQYNGLDITREAPFEDLRSYDPRVAQDFPDPVQSDWSTAQGGSFPGLAGLNNVNTWGPGENKALPGLIWLSYFSGELPQFEFAVNRQIGLQPAITSDVPELWELRDPITVDLNPNGNPNPFPNIGTRQIEILNSTSLTRMEDIIIESNQEWLEFQTIVTGPISKTPNPIASPTRSGYIDYIDNGILGSLVDELDADTEDDGTVTLEVRCDPTKLESGEDAQDDPEIEKTGIYVGYLTFKSHNALVSPVRIKVTFIYFRPPLEGQSPNGSGLGGVVLNLSNRYGDENTLIFGTGDRGTTRVDSVFGEFAYRSDFVTNRLDARFFPVDALGNEISLLQSGEIYGMGDFATNDEQRKANSRDIRSADDTLRSIIYKVKFNPGPGNPDQAYPIVVEWNVQDIPDGAQAFIRDTRNGQLFNPVDMINEGEEIGVNARSFKIDDPRVREFLIEYTLPKVIDYVDETGAPIIKEGWNLLSMPVEPLNKNFENIYPNALNKPYYFFLSSYQEEQVLKPGRGYFVKYGDNLDTKFAGVFISEINKDMNPVRVWPGDADKGGWNTIGCTSVPINVTDDDQFDFEALLDGGEAPDVDYTLAAGVYSYRTGQGYFEVTEMRPGLGYWAKVDRDGYLELNAPFVTGKTGFNAATLNRDNVKSRANEIVVSDNNQSRTSVYLSDADVSADNFELPPLPPSFDVRFTNNAELSTDDNSVIALNNVEYPISISVNNPDTKLVFTDAATGQNYGVVNPGEFGVVEIANSSDYIAVSKVETENGEFKAGVYPNVVNSVATLKYNLPEDTYVNVSIYNQVGSLVSTVVDGQANAGANTAEINVNNLNSGSYLVKVTAGSYSEIVRIQVVK